MSGGSEADARRYAREIERAWTRLLERPAVVSPRDWQRVQDWYERGIPLGIVLEALETARGRKGRPPHSMGYLAPAVEEAWRVVIEGRLGEGETGSAPQPDPNAAVESWRRRSATERQGSALRALLERELKALADGGAVADAERRLELELLDAVEPERLAEVSAEVERELQRFRGRLDGQELERTRRRAVVDRLRRALALARLS